MSIKVLLWDIDGTLLNFHESEKYAIRKCFEEVGFPYCTDDMLLEYSQINARYWKRLEKGEISREQVLEGRFAEFFSNHHLDISIAKQFNELYQHNLGDTVCHNFGAYETVKGFKGRLEQYAVTNGSKVAQSRKLKKSGYDQLMDDIFISEDIGYEKPSLGFFEAVWKEANLNRFNLNEIMIIGDSLTSDICGGKNMGICSCWFNPNHIPNETEINPDHIIDSIPKIMDIMKLIH